MLILGVVDGGCINMQYALRCQAQFHKCNAVVYHQDGVAIKASPKIPASRKSVQERYCQNWFGSACYCQKFIRERLFLSKLVLERQLLSKSVRECLLLKPCPIVLQLLGPGFCFWRVGRSFDHLSNVNFTAYGMHCILCKRHAKSQQFSCKCNILLYKFWFWICL